MHQPHHQTVRRRTQNRHRRPHQSHPPPHHLARLGHDPRRTRPSGLGPPDRHRPRHASSPCVWKHPQQIGEPAKCLVPFAELQKLGKTCPADETLDLEVLGEDKLLLRHRIGSHPVEQVITSAPVGDFPELPQITAKSISLDEAARATLLDALACASDDETRVILNGAYLDVSKPTGHYAVATDGRHLFSSNSLHLALPSSVLIPDHRFLSWSGFVKDGQWKLAVQPPTKDKGGYSKLESRRWTFYHQADRGHVPQLAQHHRGCARVHRHHRGQRPGGRSHGAHRAPAAGRRHAQPHGGPVLRVRAGSTCAAATKTRNGPRKWKCPASRSAVIPPRCTSTGSICSRPSALACVPSACRNR